MSTTREKLIELVDDYTEPLSAKDIHKADFVENFADHLIANDVVSVVRCKECKHYVQFLQDNKECRCTIFSGCYDRPYPTEPDDFCSYGERREGE